MNNKFIPIILLATILLTSSTVLAQSYAASSSKNKKYEQKIDAGIKKTAGEFSNVCKVFITTKNNRENQTAYTKSNSWECGFANPPPPPPPPKNKPPVVKVDSPIKCDIGVTCTMNANATDSDGNITAVSWMQKSGQSVNITNPAGNNLSAVFTPPANDTYTFTVTATDNNQSSTSKGVVVNVGQVTPPPPPPTCKPDEHLENGVCVPNPTPSGNTTKVIFTGDVEGSSVFNAIKAAKPDFVVTNGDLYYDSNLNVYKSTFLQTFGDKSACTIGNHDAPEDGSAAIYAEAKQVCGEVWFKKLANNTAIIGFNSNGDIPSQLNTAKGYDLSDVQNVVISSHKPCATTPNSHHPVEPGVKAFCDGIMPELLGKNVYLIAAHNHVMAESSDGHWFISGAGGKSHYVCDTNALWNFCNNQNYGYLQLNIDNNSSAVTSNFYGTNGQVLH